MLGKGLSLYLHIINVLDKSISQIEGLTACIPEILLRCGGGELLWSVETLRRREGEQVWGARDDKAGRVWCSSLLSRISLLVE